MSAPAPLESSVKEIFGNCDAAKVPAVLGSLITEITRGCHPPEEAVVAVAIATAAAAVGSKVSFLRGGRRIRPAFNVVVSHKAPRTLTWFDHIVAPLTDIGFSKEVGTNTVNSPGSSAASQSLLTSRISPKELAGMLPQSLDLGLTSVACGNDPGCELLGLKGNERNLLSELLNRSWIGVPLSFGTLVRPGNLSILWQTRRSVEDLLGNNGFGPELIAPPVLFLCDDSSPSLQLLSNDLWRTCIELLFDTCGRIPRTSCTLDNDACTVLDNFAYQIERALSGFADAFRPHVAWLPELAPRIAVMFLVLGCENTNAVNKQTAADAVELTRAIGRQHFLALVDALKPDRTDNADRKVVMLQKIRQHGPLSRRELRRKYDKPASEWFSPALESLISEGTVLFENDLLAAAIPPS